jgi:hypothetical protein
MAVKLVIVNDDSPKWFTEKLVSDYRLSGMRRPSTPEYVSASVCFWRSRAVARSVFPCAYSGLTYHPCLD